MAEPFPLSSFPITSATIHYKKTKKEPKSKTGSSKFKHNNFITKFPFFLEKKLPEGVGERDKVEERVGTDEVMIGK